MSDIKTFTFTKEVAAAAGVGGTRRKRKQTQKSPLPEEDFSLTHKTPLVIHKQGGSPPAPILHVSLPTSPLAPHVPPAPKAASIAASIASSVPHDVPRPSHVEAPHEQEGGAKNIRVELKKKTETKSVCLRPKTDTQTKKAHTKRRSKVVLGLCSLRKRITRAKHIHRNIKNMPLDKLKEELIKKNLIRPTSKAPESVLRQIARDSRMVATSM